FTAWTGAELAADLLQSFDMLGRFSRVRAERLLELRVIRRFRHLGERPHELLLRAIQILQFIDVKVLQGLELHVHTSTGLPCDRMISFLVIEAIAVPLTRGKATCIFPFRG